MSTLNSFLNTLWSVLKKPVSFTATQQKTEPNLLLFQGLEKAAGSRGEPKAVIPKWYYTAFKGQPRGVNLTEIRELAQSAWVSMCINTIINEVTSIDWDIVPRKGTGTAQAHADQIREFFEHPNANDESWKQILRATTRDILEVDAGVMEKVFGGDKKLKEIYARDGATFIKDIDVHGVIDGYYQYSYTNPAYYPEFGEQEIVYIMQHPRSYSPYGYSAVQALADILKTLVYSIDWNKRYFQENAIPSGILSIMGMSEYEKQRFEEYWNSKIKGQPHKLPVIHTDAKWQPFSLSHEDLKFLESQQWYLKLTMACFGVTPNELGFTETVNKASSESQSKIFRRKAVKPLIDLLEYHINLEIVPEFGFSDVEFRFIPSTDLDEELLKRRVWELDIKYGVRTPNEIREEMGLEPVPWGNMPFQPLSNPMQFEEEELDNGNIEQAFKQADLALQTLPANYTSLDPLKQQEIIAPAVEFFRKIENALAAGEKIENIRLLLQKKAEELNINFKPEKSPKMLEIEAKYKQSIEKLLYQWRNEGKSTHQIAKLCGVNSRSTVLNWMKLFGVD